MPTIKITTAQNIDIDYEVASVSERLTARLVDYFIFICVYSAMMIIFGLYLGVGDPNDVAAFGERGVFILFAIWGMFCALYDLFTEIFLNGQSIGKRSVKIKVISLNGSRPTVGQYILRWIFRTIDFSLTMGSAALITVAFSENKQRIGDMIAGTTLVKAMPRNNFNELAFGPPEENYEPTYREVVQLTDSDLVLIHDVIKNFNRTANSSLVYRLAVKLKKHLNISYASNINEYQFLEIVLKDYNYFTASAGFNG